MGALCAVEMLNNLTDYCSAGGFCSGESSVAENARWNAFSSSTTLSAMVGGVACDDHALCEKCFTTGNPTCQSMYEAGDFSSAREVLLLLSELDTTCARYFCD